MSLLTTREKEVMELVISGLNNIEISEKLYISRHTTKAHLVSIYKKYGVKNRVMAVRYELEKRMRERQSKLI